MSSSLLLNINVYYGIQSLALCLVGKQSKEALTKFSYSSFGVGVSDISRSASICFLVLTYFYLKYPCC